MAYLIKTTYVATKKNSNFYPSIREYVAGKNSSRLVKNTGKSIGSEIVYTIDECFNIDPDDSYKTINNRAFNRYKSLAEHENNFGYWNVKVEWIKQ